MKKEKVLKRGGIDTILAYVVVSIPLFYVLIFMIATLYHFSVQMHLNQTLKETLIMASSYGRLTDGMMEYLFNSIKNVGDEGTTWKIRFGVRSINDAGNISDIDIYPSAGFIGGITSGDDIPYELENLLEDENGRLYNINKGDLLSIELVSEQPALLHTLSNFSLFGGNAGSGTQLNYSSYREEIIANVNPNDT